MEDEAYMNQLELNLAVARDNDERGLISLHLSIILVRKAQKINEELADTRTYEKEERNFFTTNRGSMPLVNHFKHLLNRNGTQ